MRLSAGDLKVWVMVKGPSSTSLGPDTKMLYLDFTISQNGKQDFCPDGVHMEEEGSHAGHFNQTRK
jgi:hypothetical protein